MNFWQEYGFGNYMNGTIKFINLKYRCFICKLIYYFTLNGYCDIF
ncbi:hypothetical protein CLL_A2136 [Clostridium botulinum B str. Eklund 17B (NRP)]|uniref:Uncharacterized protein n=1 Tax=Clostridium botulinum (strain Eklund 17B / Type B) TaxID=935198 RepID=B2TLN9_CLOBB|nr:hypothetical protein CLL_A2136 [Clostridium botulinum B str. Eklund 17B (NRP)]CDH91042.1 hypothetical protein CB17B2053 [Clostridium botulinum B str. Eklund 17B (NRP)]